jgi:lipopolysaccharide/colanic/teichoic acid biosynthesis glycosyltransferase
MRVVHITTVPETLWFFRSQIECLIRAGETVEVIASPGPELDELGRRCGIKTHAIPMLRRISPLHDIEALARLWWVLRQMKPDVVHASTPKAALLGLTAGLLAGVPVNIFHVLGLPHLAAKGTRRFALIASTIWSYLLADSVFCVGPSMASIVRKYPGKDKTFVPGFGSVDGVDAMSRFDPYHFQRSKSEEFRRNLGISLDAMVALFVGRLVRDKGVVELAIAWTKLTSDWPGTYLVLAGKVEAHDPLPQDTLALLQQSPNVRFCGYIEDTPVAYAAADIFVLPTYREGLGCVLIEAGAMGLPVIATRVPGCVDAVVDGITGTLIPARDADALENALQRYLADDKLRAQHGRAGRAHALDRFLPEPIREQTYAEYKRLLTRHRRRSYRLCKRALDLGVATTLLILLSPVLLCLALIVRFWIGSPILFRQMRPGLHGRPFTMYKFRTLTDERDMEGALLPDEERLPALGQFLRSMSLDELPELWHVLTGEMSLVGPRPLLMEYLPRYSRTQARRHEVKPGITGWAQINGRNRLSWDEKFELDVWYVENGSMLRDLSILFRTVGAVFRRDGISHQGHVAMPLFLGTERRPGNG